MLALVRYGFRVHPSGTAIVLGSALVTAGMGVANAWLLGAVVARLPGVVGGGDAGPVLTALGALVALMSLAVVLDGFEFPVMQALSLRTELDVLGRLGRLHVGPTRVTHLEDPEYLDRVQRVRSRVWEVNQGLVQGGEFVSGGLGLVGAALTVGALFSWAWAVGLLVFAVVVSTLHARLAQRELDHWVGATADQRHADYAFEVATDTAAKEVRVFGLAEWLAERYVARATASFLPSWGQRRRNGRRSAGLELVRTVVAVAALVAVVDAVIGGRLTVGAAATTFPLVLALASTDVTGFRLVACAGAASSSLTSSRPSGGTAPPAPGAPSPPGARPRSSSRTSPSPTRVGPSRSSTACRCGSPRARASPSSGSTEPGSPRSSGSSPARSSRPRAASSSTASTSRPHRSPSSPTGSVGSRSSPRSSAATPCPRPTTSPSGSARGQPGADAPALADAADRAGASDVVAGLPAAGRLPLDPTFEGGQDLSGGEWQRLALARALHAVDRGAGALVLDEPAAALDVRAEADLVRRHLHLARGVTSLVVSHRFSVVRPVPRICVIEDGRVVEDGSHDALMAAGGRYARMFTAQSSRLVGEGGGAG